MYNVSDAYKTQINKQYRNYSYIKIEYRLSDPDAIRATTITDNQRMVSSNIEDVLLEIPPTRFYTTLELNRFVLDGKRTLIPKTPPFEQQGYISDDIANADGIFVNQPTITVDFNDYFQFPGISFVFDETEGEHPTKIGIIAYNNGVEVYNVDVSITSATFTHNGQIPLHNKLEIVFKEGLPYRRARLQTLIYGIQEILRENNLEEASIEYELDPITTKLPTTKITFTRLDPENKYNPEDSTGLWKYLEEGQRVSVFLGYELDNGDVEWVEMAKTYTTGEVKVTGNKLTAKVEFEASSRLAQKTDNYTEGKYYSNGRSLYDLAMDVATFGEFEREIVLDDGLRTIITRVPLPTRSISECLQLIANAAQMTLSTERNGNTKIAPLSTDVQDFVFDYTKMTTIPETRKYPYLKNLTTNYTNVIVGTNKVIAQDIEVANANNSVIEISHTCSTEHSYSVSGNVTVNSVEHFAYMSRFNVTGTGAITVSGKNIDFITASLAVQFSQVGDNLEMSNELIDSQDKALTYANWIGSDIMRQNEYKIEHRGYPEIDVGDNVAMQTNYKADVPVTVLQNKTSYNGALKGEGKLLIRN